MVLGVALFIFAIDGPIQVLGPIVARDVYDGARTWGLTSAAMSPGATCARRRTWGRVIWWSRRAAASAGENR